VASAALLERLAMRREGHLRESTWAKGEWTDDLVYALLQDEWQSGSR
jgi:RimJ/RimL family protein N-acetyltransferase